MTWRFQFSLRALLALALIAAGASKWLVWKRASLQREREAEAEIIRRTGTVLHQVVPSDHGWFERFLGTDRTITAIEVCFDAGPATDVDLSIVARLPTVERLTIYCNQVQPITPLGLRQLSNLKLRSLIIIGTAIGDEGLMELKDHVALERLELRENGISEIGIACLQKLIKLRVLDVGFELSENEKRRLKAAIPNCDIIDF